MRYLFVCFLLMLTACEAVSPKTDFEFIILNKSKDDLAWLKVYAQDENPFNFAKVGKPIEVATFQSVKAGENSILKSVDIQKVSPSGFGSFDIIAQKKNRNDTIRVGGGIYRNYRHDDSMPRNWHTAEINIIQRDKDTGLEMYASIARYKNGVFVERYGR